jgi:hypothetical protein
VIALVLAAHIAVAHPHSGAIARREAIPPPEVTFSGSCYQLNIYGTLYGVNQPTVTWANETSVTLYGTYTVSSLTGPLASGSFYLLPPHDEIITNKDGVTGTVHYIDQTGFTTTAPYARVDVTTEYGSQSFLQICAQ